MLASLEAIIRLYCVWTACLCCCAVTIKVLTDCNYTISTSRTSNTFSNFGNNEIKIPEPKQGRFIRVKSRLAAPCRVIGVINLHPRFSRSLGPTLGPVMSATENVKNYSLNFKDVQQSTDDHQSGIKFLPMPKLHSIRFVWLKLHWRKWVSWQQIKKYTGAKK